MNYKRLTEILRDIIGDHKLCVVQKRALQTVIEQIESGELLPVPKATIYFIRDATFPKDAVIIDPNIEFLPVYIVRNLKGNGYFLNKKEAEKRLAKIKGKI